MCLKSAGILRDLYCSNNLRSNLCYSAWCFKLFLHDLLNNCFNIHRFSAGCTNVLMLWSPKNNWQFTNTYNVMPALISSLTSIMYWVHSRGFLCTARTCGRTGWHFFSFKEAFENRETNPETSQTLDTIASEHTKIFVSDASYNCHDQSQFQLDWDGLYSNFSPTTHPAWLVSKWPHIASKCQVEKLKM